MATLRIGLAQMNPTVGDLAGNRALIAGLYAEAVAAKCDIVAFSELSVTGYPPEDLVLKSGFVRDNRIVLEDLAKLTGSCVAVIGFVDRGIGQQISSGQPVIYNAAAVCSHGAIQGVYHKRLLPNYDVFDEERTFAPGSGDHQILRLLESSLRSPFVKIFGAPMDQWPNRRAVGHKSTSTSTVPHFTVAS